MKSLKETESYFLFIGKQLYKLDYQHQQNILNIVKKYDTHKSRSQLITDINNEIKNAETAITSLLIHYLKSVFLKGFNETHKEYSIKKLFVLQQLQKEDNLKIKGGFLDEVTPYNLSFMEQFFETYETPFMKGWNDEQKKAIFGFLEDLMMTGYSYDRAERGLKKLLGENPYGMDNKTYWEMVGRTEGTRVFTQANIASAKSLGYTMKRVKTVVGCVECKMYEEQGAIPINQPFANTPIDNPDIPFHPNCMCHYEFELEQGKYFSQYSYEPDKKLQPEVDLLAYDADLSIMNAEQLQRWADINLKTPVDLSLNFKSIIQFLLVSEFGENDYIDHLVDFFIDTVDKNNLLNLLGQKPFSDDLLAGSYILNAIKKWIEEGKNKDIFDNLFYGWLGDMFLNSQRELVMLVKEAEQKFGKLNLDVIKLFIFVETDKGMSYPLGYFWSYDNTLNVTAFKEYAEYLMVKGNDFGLTVDGKIWNSIPSYKGNFYHELAHYLDYYKWEDAKPDDNYFTNKAMEYGYTELIEDIREQNERDIEILKLKLENYRQAYLRKEITYEQFEEKRLETFIKISDIDKNSLVNKMYKTSGYSKLKDGRNMETFAENFSTYYLYKQEYDLAVKQVEKWDKDQKEFYEKIYQDVLKNNKPS